jgi:hypothetical protein
VDIQRLSDLEIAPEYQYLTSIIILICMGRFLDTVIMLIVDTMHSPIPVEHWLQPVLQS